MVKQAQTALIKIWTCLKLIIMRLLVVSSRRQEKLSATLNLPSSFDWGRSILIDTRVLVSIVKWCSLTNPPRPSVLNHSLSMDHCLIRQNFEKWQRFSARIIRKYINLQTSHESSFHTLFLFSTKLHNNTKFRMLFPAVMMIND
jgi:hypothetical protein